MVIRLLLILICAATPTAAAEQDLQTLRDRLIRSILPNDPAGKKEVIEKANAHASALRDDATWPDLNYADQARTQWQALRHLDRVLLMTRAYRLSNDASLLPKIHAALDHWLAHDYRNPNWWQNEIGAPQLIGQTILLLQPNVSPRQLEQCAVLIRRSDWKGWTGQNLVWGVTIQIIRGLIESDLDAITQAFDRMHDEIRITKGEGIQPDFSFHQHGPQFYSGGYGLAFAQDVPRYASYAWGTRWQIPGDKLAILTGYLLDGEQWMMHRDRFDHSAIGRQITRPGDAAVPRSWTSGPVAPVGAAYGLLNAVTLLAQQPVPRRDELQRFAARMRGGDGEPLVGNRHFWRSDYMAHHRPGWFASVRMFSTRMVNSELVNDEGKRSQHLADGCNLLYLDGDEYLGIFPVWDWTKIPGTTAEAALEVEQPRSIRVFGKTSFVGGVSDGEFGLAAMNLTRGKLAARKAWFFFDDGYLAMGAGIACTSDNPVATTINQCLLNGDVERGKNWIHHADVGYVFPRQEARLTTNEQQGRWSDIGVGSDKIIRRSVFNLWIDHGIKSSDAAYEYVVLPRVTIGETANAATKQPARVIRNTPQLQAVIHHASGAVACVFAEKGELKYEATRIAVDQPCLLLLRDRKVTLSNPHNAPLTVNVRINDQSIRVELPEGDPAGSSRTFNLAN